MKLTVFKIFRRSQDSIQILYAGNWNGLKRENVNKTKFPKLINNFPFEIFPVFFLLSVIHS